MIFYIPLLFLFLLVGNILPYNEAQLSFFTTEILFYYKQGKNRTNEFELYYFLEGAFLLLFSKFDIVHGHRYPYSLALVLLKGLVLKQVKEDGATLVPC